MLLMLLSLLSLSVNVSDEFMNDEERESRGEGGGGRVLIVMIECIKKVEKGGWTKDDWRKRDHV